MQVARPCWHKTHCAVEDKVQHKYKLEPESLSVRGGEGNQREERGGWQVVLISTELIETH